MFKKTAPIVFMILIACSAFAGPTRIENTSLQVVYTTSNIHNTSRTSLFSYTQRILAKVNGKNLVYECAERDLNCPDLEAGKAYRADQEKSVIYILKSSPDGSKTYSTKFKQVGNW